MAARGSLVKTLERYCCCKGEDSDDDRNTLVRNEEREWPHGVGSDVVANRRVGSNGFPPTMGAGPFHSPSTIAGGSLPRPQNASLPTTPRTQDQEEEEALNRILDKTQQSIIDVSNLDASTLDVDVVQRARIYSEAVKRHDAIIEKRKSPFGTPPAAPTPHPTPSHGFNAPSSSQRQQTASTSNGNHVNEKLAQIFRQPDDPSKLAVQVECKEELIVHMNMD